jgi:hypothetical protein
LLPLVQVATTTPWRERGGGDALAHQNFLLLIMAFSIWAKVQVKE